MGKGAAASVGGAYLFVPAALFWATAKPAVRSNPAAGIALDSSLILLNVTQ